MALPIGTILHGRYLIGRTLGDGGFGITYIALDLTEQKRVALKEFYPHTFAFRIPGGTLVENGNEKAFRSCMRRFEAEAQTIYGLRTLPNIIHIETLFRENNTAYYVMEYLEGQDLDHYLRSKGGRITFTEAVTLISPLLETLQRIHDVSVIHRDISPDNIFLCDNKQVKLIDFGAARASMYEVTETTNISLKPGYAAVEQYTIHSDQGAWTDVYGMACTLYRCVAGFIPNDALERKAMDRLEPPSRFCDITPEQEAVLLRGMEVDANRRWQRMDEFGQALHNSLHKQERNQTVPAKSFSHAPNVSLYALRIAAGLLDFVPFVLFGSLLLFLASGGVYSASSVCLGGMTGLVLAAIASTAFEFFSKQHTSVGKALVGLRVHEFSLGAPPFWKILLRNGLRLLDAWLFLLSIGCFSLHDFALSTHVCAAKELAPSAVAASQERTSALSSEALCIQGVEGMYKNASLPLSETPIIMGRDSAQCNLIFPANAQGVSSVHCSVTLLGNNHLAEIVDLGSTYGTVVNRCTTLHRNERYTLAIGDCFSIGTQSFIVTLR